ncbi:ImmA/IrrE family metallo-endopeptidase [Cryptosporangium sp. NPDC051539]|uniref:ImmA/IrrE family metallo-endopeptidase n=1 Tax=Cryptosporangium sp. NPDC051539 TaxID=3363962 RepID=UPI0037A3D7C9
MPTIPERVLSLIDESGLSRRDFGKQVGLDESKMSKSLSGARRFSSVDLARIAEFSRVTVDWLITGEETPLTVAARTTTGEAGEALAAARSLLTLRSDVASLGYLQGWSPIAMPAESLRYAVYGRDAAANALARLDERGFRILDEDLAAVIEGSFGVDVTVVEAGQGCDGLAASSDEAKLIVLATSQIPSRQRFTAAHELGHLLAGDDQGVHLDKDVYSPLQAKDPSEARANAFAAAFLMPEAILSDAVGPGFDEAAFAALACHLLVTPTALAIRLRDLRMIDSGLCDRLRSLSAGRAAGLAGKTEELARRVAEALRPRAPGLLLRDTYAAYVEGRATLRPYATLLGADVESLRLALESESEGPDAT